MTLVKFKNGNGLSSFPTMTRSFGFPLFNESLDRFWSDDDSINWMPSVNIKERAEDFKIDLAVPGMDKKDFTVEVENNILTVSGERKEETKEESEKVTRREFHYGSFKRSFNLPDTADHEKIAANYNNGVLTLTVAKKENSKFKKQITIG